MLIDFSKLMGMYSYQNYQKPTNHVLFLKTPTSLSNAFICALNYAFFAIAVYKIKQGIPAIGASIPPTKKAYFNNLKPALLM